MTFVQLTSFKGLRRQDVRDAWEKFSIDNPEFVDAESDLALLSDSRAPKPDYGNKMAKGETWVGDDKQRTRRNRSPRRRPSSEMAMSDGSPLRRATTDPDTEPRLIHAAGDDDRWEWAGAHGGGISYSPEKSPHLLEFCELCGRPLPLDWPLAECEFSARPLSPGEFCHCNVCLRGPNRGPDRPRYCPDRCASRMENALRRAHRRVVGARTRVVDPDADRRADYKVEMRLKAIERKVQDARFRFDWAGIWTYPVTKPRHITYSCYSSQEHVWKITLISA